MKKHKRTQLMIVISATGVVALFAGCSSVEDRHVVDRTTQVRPSMTQATEGYDTFGRRWDGTEKVQVRESVPPEPKGLVNIVKRVPASVAVGEEYTSELAVTATDEAGNIVVTDTIPEGADYLHSDPAAAREGNMLSWKIPAMRKDEVKNIRSYYKATKEGELVSCCTVTAAPRTCASTMVGRPALSLAKTGPDTAILGTDITYTNTVSNTGTMPVRNVVLTDKVPEGLAHASGQYEVKVNIGDLAPKESKMVPIVLKTMKRGKVCNTSLASSSNAGEVNAEACTHVMQPGLAVLKTGDAEQYLNHRAGYTITVTNTGDTTLTGVTVTDTAPEPTDIVNADGAVISGKTATWQLPELAPGQARTFKTLLTSKVAGTHQNQVAATSSNLRDVAQVSTVWRGLAAMLIEVIDDLDPVQIGESTTYTIRITNQGTAPETNIGLDVKFPDEIKPVSAEGLTVEGQTITASKIPSLEPKQTVVYTIKATGLKKGDARVKVTMTADGLSTPVVEEESTHIY